MLRRSPGRLAGELAAFAMLVVTVSACSTVAAKPTPGGPPPVGTYRAVTPLDSTAMQFLADSKYADPDVGVSGTYTLTGDKIVFTETQGPCTGYPGTYLWTFDGKTLTLQAIEDKCPMERKQDLSRAWVKQP